MPDVAGGWFCSLLGMLGGISGGNFCIWEGIGCCKPIWDVLAPQGEQERALIVSQRLPEVRPSQLGRQCQLGLLGLGFAAGLAGLGLSWIYLYITVYTTHLHTSHPFL